VKIIDYRTDPFPWSGVADGTVTMVDDQHASASATLSPGSHPSLLVQDNGAHPNYTNTLGGEYKIDVLKVEFDNVWDRNLEHEDDEYPDYEKCIAVEHDDGGELDLEDYLKIEPDSLTFDDIKGNIALVVTEPIFDSFLDPAEIDDGSAVLEYRHADPGDTDIYAYGIELRWTADDTVLDRLIVVIYSGFSLTDWTNWVNNATYGNAAGDNWLNELPPVYSELNDDPGDIDPEPPECDPQQWRGVKTGDDLPRFYHFNASFEMRSVATAGAHGHQACYAADGNLIVPVEGDIATLASSGTADHRAPTVPPTLGHPIHDVWPFIRAAQMDGNPIDGLENLNHPLIRIGAHLQDYYDRRPARTANTVAHDECCDPAVCTVH